MCITPLQFFVYNMTTTIALCTAKHRQSVVITDGRERQWSEKWLSALNNVGWRLVILLLFNCFCLHSYVSSVTSRSMLWHSVIVCELKLAQQGAFRITTEVNLCHLSPGVLLASNMMLSYLAWLRRIVFHTNVSRDSNVSLLGEIIVQRQQ